MSCALFKLVLNWYCFFLNRMDVYNEVFALFHTSSIWVLDGIF